MTRRGMASQGATNAFYVETKGILRGIAISKWRFPTKWSRGEIGPCKSWCGGVLLLSLLFSCLLQRVGSWPIWCLLLNFLLGRGWSLAQLGWLLDHCKVLLLLLWWGHFWKYSIYYPTVLKDKTYFCLLGMWVEVLVWWLQCVILCILGLYISWGWGQKRWTSRFHVDMLG